jgi:4-diphosphocytidyl-2-C-methyl-D-erythritol kinase
LSLSLPILGQDAGTSFSLPAFAKINWSLKVLGRRPDGYHQIETVLQTVAVHDTLTFTARNDSEIQLHCDTPGIPSDGSNLVVRAALSLRERIGVRVGADIQLEKQIPAPGGLGGGSSDAAVTLIGLCRLWNVEPETDVLVELGRQLGADVPFFFIGGTALGTGLGDRITPWNDVETTPLVIVSPNVSMPTAAAYAALGASALTKDFQESILSVSPLSEENGRFPPQRMRNDFDLVVCQAHAEVARTKELLLEHGAQTAMLCGSGASVFGTFTDRETQAKAAATIGASTDCKVFATETLSRSDYALAIGSRR